MGLPRAKYRMPPMGVTTTQSTTHSHFGSTLTDLEGALAAKTVTKTVKIIKTANANRIALMSLTLLRIET
jgi:hypothetical protein